MSDHVYDTKTHQAEQPSQTEQRGSAAGGALLAAVMRKKIQRRALARAGGQGVGAGSRESTDDGDAGPQRPAQALAIAPQRGAKPRPKAPPGPKGSPNPALTAATAPPAAATAPAAGGSADHAAHGSGSGGALAMGDGNGAAPAAGPTAEQRATAAHTHIAHNTDLAPENGGNFERTTVAVGELVHLNTTVNGDWHAARTGQGGDGVSKTDDMFYDWVAPSTAGAVVITFTPKDNPKAVKRVTFQVIAPMGMRFVKTGSSGYPGATSPSAGVMMNTDVHFTPNTVNWSGVGWFEVPHDAVGATGYFKKNPPPAHDAAAGAGHWSEGMPGTDQAGWNFWGAPFEAGQFDWPIVNKWHVTADGDDGHVLTTTHQHCTMAKNGTLTVTKGGQSASAAAI